MKTIGDPENIKDSLAIKKKIIIIYAVWNVLSRFIAFHKNISILTPE